MAPLDEYLEAVKILLPTSQREAIGRELAADLRSRLEARAKELGRPLSEQEQLELLRRHGHPMAVAARYRSQPRPVGPLMLPVYLLTLKLGIGAALIVTLVSTVIDSLNAPDPLIQIANGLLAFPQRVLNVVVGTTVAFVALELAQRRLPGLPRFDPGRLAKIRQPPQRRSRLGAIIEAVFACAGVTWLLLLPGRPYLLLGPAAHYIAPGDPWRSVYGPVLFVMTASALIDVAEAIRPAWSRIRTYMRLALNAAIFVILVVLLDARPLFVPLPVAAGPDGMSPAEGARAIDAAFRVALVVLGVTTGIEMIRQMIRLKDDRLARLAAAVGQPASNA